MKLSFLLLSVFALLLSVTSAQAQRTQSSMSSLVNPVATHAVATLIRNGDHLIGGGVFFEGSADFVLEAGSGERIAINDDSLTLSYSNGVWLEVANGLSNVTRFKYSMHRHLACPLGRFTQRGGRLVFSLPSDTSEAGQKKLRSMGLEPYRNTGFWVAREFRRNDVVALLLAIDFGRVEDLPTQLERPIQVEINKLIGARGQFSRNERLSYFNTDSMSNIETYLMPGQRSAESSGVPLRFSWNSQGERTAVTRIEIYSQNFGTKRISDITNLDIPRVDQVKSREDVDAVVAAFDQIDIVNVYQAAAVFRTLRSSNPKNFSEFVGDACRDSRYSGIRR